MALATVPPDGLGNTEPIFIFILPLKHGKTFLNVNIFQKVCDEKNLEIYSFGLKIRKFKEEKKKGNPESV